MASASEDVTALVRTMVEQLVDEPAAVQVTGSNPRASELFIEVSVAESDIGKVIGRQGRIIKALRTLARAAASQYGLQVEVELAE